MLGYITLGTDNLGTAGAFYDVIIDMLGGRRLESNDRFIFWGTTYDDPMLAVCTPHDGKAASVGNGNMVAFRADSENAVRKIHKKALELGASNEGMPGERDEGFFAAYLRDLDGHKLAVYKLGSK